MACLKARKTDDSECAAKKIAKRQLRYQQLPMEGSATSPDGGSVLAELASVSSFAVGITKVRNAEDESLSACRTEASKVTDLPRLASPRPLLADPLVDRIGRQQVR